MSDTHAETAFIRTEMLAPELPPVTERGAIKWLRENLFAGWLNTALTLVSLLLVVMLLAKILPWWLNGVWNATSLGECRTIAGPEGGACWAVIKARWHQYIFGFYPQDAYWRPILAFALMFVALAPVLYYGLRSGAKLIGVVAVLTVLSLALLDHDITHAIAIAALMAALFALAWVAPKRLVYLTLLYPFIAFWLLWGGSIWKPVATMAGFAVMALAYRVIQPRLGVIMATSMGFIAACLYWLFVQGLITGALSGLQPSLPAVNSDQFGGFLLAFVIGVTAITCSLPIGVLLALGRRSDMVLIKTLSVGFIEFIRGVPLITMLFTASLLLQYFLPPQTNFDLILRVVILVTLFAAAYIAEVIRGGLAALPRGQYEAADALGLDYWQAQRLIIMPQALKISIPGIVSTFIGLFKDTTLVSFVGLLDPLRGVTQIVRADINWKGIYWEPYIFVGFIFFLICFGMSRYSMYLEQKLKTDHR